MNCFWGKDKFILGLVNFFIYLFFPIFRHRREFEDLQRRQQSELQEFILSLQVKQSGAHQPVKKD